MELDEFYTGLEQEKYTSIAEKYNNLLQEISKGFTNIQQLISGIITSNVPVDELINNKSVNEASQKYDETVIKIENAIKSVKDRISRFNELIPNIEKDQYLDQNKAHDITLDINTETSIIKNIINTVDLYTNITKIEKKIIKPYCEEYMVFLNGLINIIKSYNITNRKHSIDVPKIF
jgi:hypothetical protein